MDFQRIPFTRKGPPASTAEIDAFEKVIGARLPDGYRLFLQEVNGGEIEDDFGVPAHETSREYLDEDPVPVGQLYGIAEGSRLHILAHDEVYNYHLRTPQHVFPIGYSGAENRISISLGGDDYGKVYIWVPSPGELWVDEEDCRQDYGELYLLTDDFAEFWRSLRPIDPVY